MPRRGKFAWFLGVAVAFLLATAGAAMLLPESPGVDAGTSARVVPGLTAEEVATALGGQGGTPRPPERSWRGSWGSTAFWRLERGYLWVRFGPDGKAVSKEYVSDQQPWHRRLRRWLRLSTAPLPEAPGVARGPGDLTAATGQAILPT